MDTKITDRGKLTINNDDGGGHVVTREAALKYIFFDLQSLGAEENSKSAKRIMGRKEK